MNKEKILRLLKSNNEEDVLIGFNLIKDYSLTDIIDKLGAYYFGEEIFLDDTALGPSEYYKINDNVLVITGHGNMLFTDNKLYPSGSAKEI